MKEIKGRLCFTEEELNDLSSKHAYISLLKENGVSLERVQQVIDYEVELESLQAELLKLQNWIHRHEQRVVVVFEGRDAAGKGGTIRRFTRYLNPRSMRVVALSKPTPVEAGQWYFRRHVKELPNAGEIVFFDRSWYNRAVIEPVMGFCTPQEYDEFLRQVPEFEHMLTENGVRIIKFWFSITQQEQKKRFKSRRKDPLRQWKLSPVDIKVQGLWDEITYFKEEMFSRTHTSYAPWIIIRSDNKRLARLEAIRYVLSLFPYDGKEEANTVIYPDPNIVQRFHRALLTQVEFKG